MKKRVHLVVRTAVAALLLTTGISSGIAQDNFTPNGIADVRQNAFAFTHANLYQPDGSYLNNATLLIREGRIVEVGAGIDVSAGYFEVDLGNRYIYPGFVDIYTQYGIPTLEREGRTSGAENLFSADQALNVNDAIRSNFRASTAFSPESEARERFRKLGFSSVLVLRADGIARGTSALITLGDERANESIIVPDAAAHYSLAKGTSTQSMPSSLMGSFALLRQTYLDASWFTAQEPRPFTDDTLEAWTAYQSLPQIMEVNNWQQALKADKIGDEFDSQYILKVSGDSYKRAGLIANTGASLIVPIDFPDAPKVDDVIEADDVSLADLKHWELAPFNPRVLIDNEISFAITSSDADENFLSNLRKAVANGLSPQSAIDSITRIPAELLGVESLIGQLIPDAYANFVIASGDLFETDSQLLENWIRGKKHILASDFDNRDGNYRLVLEDRSYDIELTFESGKPSANILLSDDETRAITIELTDDLISLSFAEDDAGNRSRLNGWPVDQGFRGNGRSASGEMMAWQLNRVANITEESVDADVDVDVPDLPSSISLPFVAHGRESVPQQQDLLIRGATVWTNDDAGTLLADVLVRDGKIAEVGQDLSANNVVEVDGSGKHLTPGIIDEHSHIALFNINEIVTNSSMVRMKDVVDSESINIYRNLAGGVTAAQLLHGSSNPIGGQSAIIKMRWGLPPEQLLIEGADEFIKFALGENVKRSRNDESVRYPQTRMGVEQVFVNAFSQAREYDKRWDDYNSLSRSQQRSTVEPRRDLVHETMLEILNSERYVTSHSYVQSEINMLINVADSFDFNINTFTHILEGYKVADKMAQHGAGGSTFSDWWGYKWEASQAIPYNAAIMQQAGVVVAINSDDAEMSRRLNQEAAKSVKYGGMSEVDALKQVTINPAILLHLEDRMGSITLGKDADLVLWSDHPLSIYAVAETTWIEGTPYYDRQQDLLMREQIASERARIIAAIGNAGNED